MDANEVLAAFGRLADLTPEESAQWEALCRSGMETLRRMLRPGVDPEQWGTLMNLTAAAIAYHRYCLMRSGEEIHTLKVGEIQAVGGGVKGRLEGAKALMDELLEQLAPFLRHQSAAIRGVEP